MCEIVFDLQLSWQILQLYIGEISDEEGERFNQDFKVIEERDTKDFGIIILNADFCWSIKLQYIFLIHFIKE